MPYDKIEVGRPFPSMRPPLAEGVHYQFRNQQHELVMILSGLSADEIEDVRRGESEFALFQRDGVIFLLYRFGEAFPWSDCPYQWHLEPAEHRDAPRDEPTEQARALVQVTLIDAETAMVRALRTVTWSVEFTRAVNAAIRAQAAAPWDGQATYRRRLQRIWERIDSKRMLEAATARCAGGE